MVKPEEKAREVIDQLLTDAGWTVQDYKETKRNVVVLLA